MEDTYGFVGYRRSRTHDELFAPFVNVVQSKRADSSLSFYAFHEQTTGTAIAVRQFIVLRRDVWCVVEYYLRRTVAYQVRETISYRY